jgi:hypothetical protein
MADENIGASEYVHRVYHDAVSALPSAKEVWGKPAMDVYEFIRAVSPRTSDRLIELGAHQASSRVWKTAYFFDYQLGISTVPLSWYDEWTVDFGKYAPSLSMMSPTEQVVGFVAPKVKSGFESLFFAGLIAFIVMDAYGEVKTQTKRRLEM